MSKVGYRMSILACPSCGAKNACRVPVDSGQAALKQVRCYRCQKPFTLAQAAEQPSVKVPKAVRQEARLVGQMVGKFKLEKLAGVGATGAVYRAVDTMLRRTCALKVLTGFDPSDPTQLERFLLEAQTAATLLHPHVVQVFQIEQTDGHWCIAMEFMDGGSLANQLRNRTPVQPMVATQMVLDAASALAYAHEQDIVHRDIKPANLLLTRTGVVKVGDFGLAKLGGATAGLTHGQRLIGTPNYMSPEQCRGEVATAASDLYGLAGTYFALLTGRLPFESENVAGFIHKHLHEHPPNAHEVEPSVPPELALIIQQCMAKDPSHRPGSMNEFRAMVQQAIPAAWLDTYRESTFARGFSADRSVGGAGMLLTGSSSGGSVEISSASLMQSDGLAASSESIGESFLDRWRKASRLPSASVQVLYLTYYRLREPPFADSKRAPFLFEGGPFGRAGEQIRSHLLAGECLVLLECAASGGASTLLRSATASLPAFGMPGGADARRYFRGRPIGAPSEAAGGAPSQPVDPALLSWTHAEAADAAASRIGPEAGPGAAGAPGGAGAGGGSVAPSARAAARPKYFRGRLVAPHEPVQGTPADSVTSLNASGSLYKSGSFGGAGSISGGGPAQPSSSDAGSSGERFCQQVYIAGASLATQSLVSAVFRAANLGLPEADSEGYSETDLLAVLGQSQVAPLVVLVDDFDQLAHSAVMDLLALARLGARMRAKLRLVVAGRPGSFERLFKALPPEAAGGRNPPRVVLDGLSVDDLGEYLHHRLKAAGGPPEVQRFTRAAVFALRDVSMGQIGLVNILAHASLTLAYRARVDRVCARHVFQAAELTTDQILTAEPATGRQIGLRGRLARSVARTTGALPGNPAARPG